MNHPFLAPRKPFLTRFVLGAVLAGALLATGGAARQPLPEAEQKKLDAAAAELRKALADLRAARAVKNDKLPPALASIPELTRRIGVGLAAAQKALTLPSRARDYLEPALDEFDRLAEALRKDPKLQRELALHANLVVLVEETQKARAALQKRKDLTRKEELDRLKQLRDLNAGYRDLTGLAAAMNTYFLLEDHAKLRDTYAAFSEKVKELRKIAAARRDYYLFKDEPRLDAADPSELQLITKAADPVATDVLAHFQALQGLAAYRLARVSLAQDDAAEKKRGADLLAEARKLAEELTKDEKTAGLLAWYVAALAAQEQGLQKTSGNPLGAEAHRQAKPSFDAARASIGKAAARADKEASVGKRLKTEIEDRQARLASSKPFLAEAERLTVKGEPDEAARALFAGLRLHRDPALVVALAEAELRAGADLAETKARLDEAVKSGLLSEDDARGLLVRGRVELARTWDRIAAAPPGKMTDVVRGRLVGQLRDGRILLDQAAKSPDEKISKPAAAYAALAHAYAGHIDRDADEKAGRAALARMKDVSAWLQGRADGKVSESEKVAALEALAAARLAEGYLALRYRPSYREDALLAFAAAADAQARLKFSRASAKLFGSPVLSAMLSRPDMRGLKVAAEERQLRELLARVSEGMAALQLGAPAAGAAQAKASLEGVENLADDVPVDAGRLLSRKEDDVRSGLRTRARALAVMTLVSGNQPETALLEALRLPPAKLEVKRLDDLEPGDARRAAEALTDPLATFALGLALEEYAAEKLTPGSPRSRGFLAAAADVQKRTKEMLAGSRDLAERYPQVVALNAQAIERLTNPDSFLADARKHRRQARIGEAARAVEDGVRRHPANGRLQQERLLIKMDEADLRPQNNREAVEKAVEEAERARKDGTLRDAGGLIALGELYERLGRTADAVGAYEQALKATPNAEEKIKAQSRLAVLNLRLSRTRR